VARIDIETMDDARDAEANDTVVVSASPPPATLPSIHPLSMIVVFVFDEYRIGRINDALFRPKELIRRKRHARSQAWLFELNRFAD
jgi:hypothetical protein